ncbi:Hypothetical_protein [Hexamita inflata]|uniref:Hypothetical_protein n=1 Tax=Hexamita inflata TaxID=28002 RepID=A0AA86NCV2_9EUKA|nr:Hypothetical protein HINF_LOCUS5097 [Hexamita inflata]
MRYLSRLHQLYGILQTYRGSVVVQKSPSWAQNYNGSGVGRYFGPINLPAFGLAFWLGFWLVLGCPCLLDEGVWSAWSQFRLELGTFALTWALWLAWLLSFCRLALLLNRFVRLPPAFWASACAWAAFALTFLSVRLRTRLEDVVSSSSGRKSVASAPATASFGLPGELTALDLVLQLLLSSSSSLACRVIAAFRLLSGLPARFRLHFAFQQRFCSLQHRLACISAPGC